MITEIVRHGVMAVTEEMKTNLMRTAYNMIIYEALDFTVGLFTAEGETVSIGLGLPMFIRGMSETVKAKIKHFGYDDIRPGDILLTNDAYLTGSHLNHLTFTLPIFHEDKLAGFACCMAHWPDIGGTLDGMTTDIYSEGLQIPILKYQREGEINQDLVDILRMNVRLPERAMGDLRAQITAIKTGERRFLELLDRYGQKPVLDSIAAIMDNSEAAARARTLAIPDGEYEADSFMDDDGVSIGKRVSIKVKVIVKGDEATVDLTDVSEQVRGFYNSGITTGYACSQVAFQMPDLADGLSDQRRFVQEPPHDRAAGPDRQRRQARAHALVDDLPDDHHRHGLQGDDAGHAGQGDCRTSCRFVRRHGERPHPQGGKTSSSLSWARKAVGGAPNTTKMASAQRSASTTATRTTVPTSRWKRSTRCLSNATNWCRIRAVPDGSAVASVSNP